MNAMKMWLWLRGKDRVTVIDQNTGQILARVLVPHGASVTVEVPEGREIKAVVPR